MKLFIYQFTEINNFIRYLTNVVPEMDIFGLFYSSLSKLYTIVYDIDHADIAFINIDIVRIIYCIVDEKLIDTNYKPLPYYSSTFSGVEAKKYIIDYYFNNIVNPIINRNKNIPTFMLYNYVLFDIDFSSVPEFVKILAYETKVSTFNSDDLLNNGTHNRTVMIPYILNDNRYFNQERIDKFNINYKYTKQYNFGFFGCINNDNSRPILKKYRYFLKYMNFTRLGLCVFGSGKDAFNNMAKVKYLFVLRGDTITRLCFYQCFPFQVVPIVYETIATEYSKLTNIDIRESMLIIPDYNETKYSIEEYSNIVENILYMEIKDTSNYYNKIKNHEMLFNQFNYYGNLEMGPIKNAINKIF
jgi:hypothetical protein